MPNRCELQKKMRPAALTLKKWLSLGENVVSPISRPGLVACRSLRQTPACRKMRAAICCARRKMRRAEPLPSGHAAALAQPS